jgi:hypothetical protein
MFHVKQIYFKSCPIPNQTGVLDKYPVFSEKEAQIKDKTEPSESLENTGVSAVQTLKNGLFRSFSMKWKLLGSLLLLNAVCFGQLEPVAIGDWKIHLSYRNPVDIARTDTKYYLAFGNGIYVYDSEDGSHEILAKSNALSGIGISQVEYFPDLQTVVVGYSDGNIDLVSSEGEVYNMSDIKRSNIIGDKSIVNLVVYNSYVYICTGFGIVVLDPARKEIKDTYIFGPGGTNIKVNSVCFDGTNMYAATDDGLFSALLGDPFLSNYTSWTKDVSLNSSAVNGPFTDISYHGGKLFLARKVNGYNNDTVYVHDSAWGYFTPSFSNDAVKLKSIGDKMLLLGNGTLNLYDQALNTFLNLNSYNFDYIDAVDVEFSPSNNMVYIADKRYGLTRGVNTWNNERVSGNSPYSSGSSRVAAKNGVILLSHDGFAGVNGLNTFSRNILSVAYNNDWVNYNPATQPVTMNNDSIFDAVAVCIDPKDENHWFLGTYSYKGIFEFKDGAIVATFDETNSTISNAGITGYNAIAAIDMDKDGNLWAINSKSVNPLVVRKSDGSWVPVNIGSGFNNRNLYDLDASDEGLIWIAAPTGNSVGGLLVFDYNQTLEDDSDDNYFIYSSGSGSGNLPSMDVKCVTEDLDGEIWIGTANGLAIIYDQSGIFSGNRQDAQQILIEQDGNVQILFENEIINDIEVDGANRKWFATEGSGAFLMSEDGEEEILHLTKENSPLFSNIVYDIAVDPGTGDVYFATTDGLVSLRYTATGSENAYADVYAFPNPVQSNYEGIVAVKGLSRDSDFKVTDIAGNLVYHGISTGGQAIWDLKDIAGTRVSSGVYLIYCNSESGKRDAMVKLLVIN